MRTRRPVPPFAAAGASGSVGAGAPHADDDDTAHLSLHAPSVAVVAALSRAAVLGWAAACAALAPPYDTSNALLSGSPLTAVDAWAERALGHTANWDGAYFARVAARGYTSEKELAFFPGLPACLAVLRRALRPLEDAGVMHARASVLVSAAALNAAAFVAAAALLERLGRVVLRDARRARAAALLFCITPAGVFMSAVYSESLFALASFAGMLVLVLCDADANADADDARPARHYYARLAAAAALFACAGAVRSNGVVLVGYLLYSGAVEWRRRRRRARASSGSQRAPAGTAAAAATAAAIDTAAWAAHWTAVAAACALVCAPFVAFSWYGRLLACGSGGGGGGGASEWARTALAALGAGGLPPDGSSGASFAARPAAWCGAAPRALLPPPPTYARLQAAHWGVGWLAYWTAANAPQFALAAPAVALAVAAVAGADAPSGGRAAAAAAAEAASLAATLLPPLLPGAPSSRGGTGPASSLRPQLPYRVHWVALVALAAGVMHVQVVTRLVASCPGLYWFVAGLLLPRRAAAARGGGGSGGGGGGYACSSRAHEYLPALLATYCVGYTAVGTALFASFYNWT